jgi:hypothetical protein
MTRAAIALVVLSAAMLVGCEDPGFRQASEVFSPRVLAMVASHPEIGPLQTVTVSAMVVDADGSAIDDPAAFEWHACLKADDIPGLGGMMFQGGEADEGCGGFPDLTRLGAPDGTDFALTTPPVPEELIGMISEMFGENLPPGAIRAIVDEVGLPITFELTIRDPVTGELVVRGFKRVIYVAARDELGTNPPGPRFSVGDTFVRGGGSRERWVCDVPGDGALPQVRAGEVVPIRPARDDEGWREKFPVIDLAGRIVDATEGAYYSFFSTGGEFAHRVTSAPDRDTRWTAPEEPGLWPMWVVVRDGHAGVAACRIDVNVVP